VALAGRISSLARFVKCATCAGQFLRFHDFRPRAKTRSHLPLPFQSATSALLTLVCVAGGQMSGFGKRMSGLGK
jgi:hypothetical protein